MKTRDGVAVIDCGNGGVAEVGNGSCTVTSNGDGSHTITCPNGSTTIRDGEKLPRATLSGTVRRFGLPGEAGIEVTLVEHDRTVVTDEEGRFEFDDVAPGIYRLRFWRDGYVPRDVENVVVVGKDFDLGTFELKVARKITSGSAEPYPLADGRHVLLTRHEGPYYSQDLWIHDLETGEESLIAEEIEYTPFPLSEKLVAYLLFHDRAELFVYDVEARSSRSLGFVNGFWIVANGMAFNDRDGNAFFFDARTGTSTPLTGRLEDATYDGTIGFLLDDGALIAYDFARGAELNRQVFSRYCYSPESGNFAGIEERDGARVMVAVDVATGVTTDLETNDTIDQCYWEGDGQVLRFGSYFYGFKVYALATERTYTIPSNTYSVVAHPNGRWIFLYGSYGTRVENYDGTVTHEIGDFGGWVGDDWIIDYRNNTNRVIELATGEVVLERANSRVWYTGDAWGLAPSIVIFWGETLFFADLATGTTLEIEVEGESVAMSRDGSLVAAFDGEEIVLHSIADGSSRNTGIRGWPMFFTESGKTLLFAEEQDDFWSYWRVSALSVEDLAVLPIDEYSVNGDVLGGAFWYQTAAPDAFNRYGEIEDRSALELYRVVLP